MRYLFVVGPPRSGTTAMAFLLNEDHRIVLGLERFKRVRKEIEPYHFSEAVFFNPVARETDMAAPYLYARLHERWRTGDVRIIGDKVPFYTKVLPTIGERFDDYRVLFMLRDPHDVARSYLQRANDPDDDWPAENDHKVGIEHFNETLLAAQQFASSPERAARLLLVPYESLVVGDLVCLSHIYEFLGLELDDWAVKHLEQLGGLKPAADRVPLSSAQKATVDGKLDNRLLEWGRSHQAKTGGVGSQATAAQSMSVPTTDQQRSEERRRLLEDLKTTGRVEDDKEVLRDRLSDAMAELSRRRSSTQ